MTPFKMIYFYINIKLNKNQICVVKIIQGGGVAAPLGGQILSEVLPYLEIEQGNQEEVELKNEITVPDITGKTISEARKILKEYKLEMYINNYQEGIDEENTFVNIQVPQAGINVYEGSFVYVN